MTAYQLYTIPLREENNLPDVWTPEHVLARMIHAFSVLRILPASILPKAPHSAWLPVLHDLNSLGYDVQISLIEDKRANSWRMLDTASAQDISLMNEALSWSMIYLKDKPLHADALNLYGYSKATGKKAEPLLRKRHKQAIGLLAKSKQEAEEKKKTFAKQCAAWANQRIAQSPQTSESIKRIKANAHIRFERELANYAKMHGMPFTPQQAMPNKVISRERYTYYRLEAARIITAQLIKNKAVIR